MIYIKNKIETVFGFGILNSELIILSLQKNDEYKSILVEDPKLGNYVTKVVNGKLFYQKLNSQIIEYDGNEIFSYEDNFSYLSNAFVRNEHLILYNKNTKTFNQLGNKKCFDLGFYIKKTAVFKGEKFVDITDSIQISVHEFNNEKLELKWQVDISQYGERRLDRHGKEIDSNTHNNVSGELMGYEDTLVVPLAGGQLLGLNIQDGSFKWMLERGANRLLAHSNKYLYSYYRGEISEIDIQTGESLRTLDLSPFLKGIKDGLFYSNITNGKLIFDFSSDYSNLLIIDIEKLEIESYIENPYRSMMLRVGQGNCIYHENKLYARDPMSNTLYIFEEEHITQ